MALCAGLLVACQTLPPGSAAVDVDRPIADKGGFLYEVRSPERPDERFYLFGVIHYDRVFDTGQPHLMIKPSAWHRIVAADRLFVEAVAPRGKPAAAPAAHADSSLQALSEKGADSLRPLYAACGFSMEGADVQTAELFAMKRGRRVSGLETAEDRERILEAMSDDDKRRSAVYRQLSAVQHDAEASRAQVQGSGRDGECRAIEETWRAWKSEDVAAVEKELAASRDDPFMRYLIDGRNALFHERILLHLQDKGSMFVALGALHLYGENGLLERFKADGYTVSWIP